jgi:hypothetical protein
MVRAVFFGSLLAAASLVGAAEESARSEKADSAVARAVKPGKAARPDTAKATGKAARPDSVAKPAKPAKAAKPDSAAKPSPAALPDPQSVYESLLRERDLLARHKQILEWEEGLAEASLRDSAAYLVVDLERQVIMAKLGGVPMRHAPILWRYERPGQAAVSGLFQVAERLATLEDSGQPAVGADSAKGDSALIDTALARLIATPRGPAPRRYDPQKRYCITLQGGPELWLATLPPAQTRMDSLEIRLRTWIRDFPAVVQHRRSIHLFLAPEDNHWIYAMAVWGARVLVIPPS